MTSQGVRFGKIHTSRLFDAQWRIASQDFPNEHQALTALQSAIRIYCGVDRFWYADVADKHMMWCYIEMGSSAYKIGVSSVTANGRINVALKTMLPVSPGDKPHHVEFIRIHLP